MSKTVVHKLFLMTILIFKVAANNYTCANYKQVIVDAFHGFINDGPGNYMENVHCEWLIIAPNNSFVTLNILNLQTECLYDYLNVYDGDSYVSGRLMASLCGNQTSQSLTTSSSKVYLFYT